MSVTRVSTYEGKYIWIWDQGKVSCLRYGEPWIEDFDVQGVNAVVALIFEADQLKKTNESFKIALEGIVGMVSELNDTRPNEAVICAEECQTVAQESLEEGVMNNKSDFLTPEQLAVTLNSPGCLFNQDGTPVVDDTLGSELQRVFKNTKEPLLSVVAEFKEADRWVDDGTPSGRIEGIQTHISHFMAWTESYVLIVLHSIFGDQYLMQIPKESSPTEGDSGPT